MSRQKQGQHSAKVLLITSSQFGQRAQSFKITILLQPSNHGYQMLTADQIRKHGRSTKAKVLQKKSKALIDNSSTEESSAEDEENSGNEEADISEDSNALITELYELEQKKFVTFFVIDIDSQS